MSRYIQQSVDNKKKVKEEKPRTLKKPGQYSSEDLQNTKIIRSSNGGKY